MPKKPLYDYYVINLECKVVPQSLYLLDQHSFAFFPSYKVQEIATLHHETLGDIKFPCLGILFYKPKGKLTLEITRKLLDDFLTCVCLIIPDYSLFKAARNVLPKSSDSFNSKIKTTVSITVAINRSMYRINNLQTSFGGTLIDYYKIESRNLRNVRLNFFPIFEHFMSMERNDKDYQAIKLLILASFMTPFVSEFYDNANMRYSLLFTLLESFLPNAKKTHTYNCKKCGAQTLRNVDKPVSDRFDDYISKLPISVELKDRAIKTFDCMRPIRNKFYHEAESHPEIGSSTNIKKLTGRSSLTYMEDLELNNGREFGPYFMQDLIQTILLTRLLDRSNRNKNAEFEDDRLWSHFKPFTVIGKVDVSFSDFVSHLHGRIMDFSELEKRIYICKSEETCKDRQIRQFYFENKNSKHPIMIICDTPSKYNKIGVENYRESNNSRNNWGESLSRIVKSLNLEDAYVTNLVKCGSYSQLCKTDISIKNCWQFLLLEIEFINPKLILCVGKTVFEILSKRNLSVPVEYVPHYNYRMNRLINSNNNDTYLTSEETIINIWKEAIVKHSLI